MLANGSRCADRLWATARFNRAHNETNFSSEPIRDLPVALSLITDVTLQDDSVIVK